VAAACQVCDLMYYKLLEHTCVQFDLPFIEREKMLVCRSSMTFKLVHWLSTVPVGVH
jgi:hypothetical protein